MLLIIFFFFFRIFESYSQSHIVFHFLRKKFLEISVSVVRGTFLFWHFADMWSKPLGRRPLFTLTLNWGPWELAATAVYHCSKKLLKMQRMVCHFGFTINVNMILICCKKYEEYKLLSDFSRAAVRNLLAVYYHNLGCIAFIPVAKCIAVHKLPVFSRSGFFGFVIRIIWCTALTLVLSD